MLKDRYWIGQGDKDISHVFPDLVSELYAIQFALADLVGDLYAIRFALESMPRDEQAKADVEEISGLSRILSQVVVNFRIIKDALYGPIETKLSEAHIATISDDED